MWPFKPAWMSDNLDVAKSAVEQIKNQRKLKKIVFSRVCSNVKEVALERIDDQDFLQKFVLSWPLMLRERWKAISLITDEDFLKKIVLDNKSDMQSQAVSRIHDEDFLKKFVQDDSRNWSFGDSAGVAAIRNIKDQDFLKKIVFDDTKSRFGEAAVDEIKDQNFLKTVVFDHPNLNMRCRAAQKIIDTDTLSTLLHNDLPYSVKAAINKTLGREDNTTFYETAKTAENLYKGQEAISKISDQRILKQLVIDLDGIAERDFFHKYASPLRGYAIDIITDLKILDELASDSNITDYSRVLIYRHIITHWNLFKDMLHRFPALHEEVEDHKEKVRKHDLLYAGRDAFTDDSKDWQKKS